MSNGRDLDFTSPLSSPPLEDGPATTDPKSLLFEASRSPRELSPLSDRRDLPSLIAGSHRAPGLATDVDWTGKKSTVGGTTESRSVSLSNNASLPPTPDHKSSQPAVSAADATTSTRAATSSLGKSPVSVLRRPTISATTPGTTDRGDSLRRSIMNRGMGTSKEQRVLQEQDSGEGPSRKRSVLIEEPMKKQNHSVTVQSLHDEEATVLPVSKKHRSKQISRMQARIDQWKRRRHTGYFAKVAKTINELRKRVLRQQDVPPSKDGRHIDLEVTRRGVRIDERRNREYIGNTVKSSRYSLWNFLPRQLFFQFGKVANFYFLVISILQMIPGLSTTGNYTTIVPLMVFICISMSKEGYDDFRRHKSDSAENNRTTRVLRVDSEYGANYNDKEDGCWTETKWLDARVGDVVQLQRDEAVPADVVLLHAEGLNGVAFIETMALDGETNLKPKQAPPSLAKRCGSVRGMIECNAHFVVEDPNLDLYAFHGRVTVDGETLPLTPNEVVYRGSILRNTPRAFAMVINTGEECKIRMNSNKNPRIKSPSLQTIVNKVVLIVVTFVLALATFMTAAYQVWYKDTERLSWYLHNARVPWGPILTSFIIMFNTMIPLSLYVSMEIIKLGQVFLMQDVDMYDPITDIPMEARTTTINEELGQVSYIFSDKTGTLTDNIMKFRKMSVAGTAWIHDVDLPQPARKGKAKEAGFSSDSDTAESQPQIRRGSIWKSTARPTKGQPELRTEDMLRYLEQHPHGVFARKARFFLLSLALCHTCLPEKTSDGTIDFQASSPDELALVRAAQELGYLVIDRAAHTISIKTHPNGPHASEEVETYEILDVIEFSSKRKRMSIIVRFPDGRRCVFCKGADSVIMKRLKHAPVALQKASVVERRSSVRKSLEVESALRRKASEATPRQSLDRASMSLSRRGSRAQTREQLDSWLKEREHDVDLTGVDSPAAYIHPEAADILVDESLAMDDAAVFERCFQHIDDFATEGLRTLLFAYKFLDEQEYGSWKKLYLEASTSLEKRKEKMEDTAELVECNFDLAGATAIEDKLQDGVPETIERLRRAKIKIWVLTGDKRETAINIGHSSRVVKDFSNLIVLDHTKDDLESKMASAVLNVEDSPHTVLVIDGGSLQVVEEDDELSAIFFELSMLADSVICCRASPSQKAYLVRQVRLNTGAVTLAIGDGANDVAMLLEANIGIGINGREGSQAARSSDYSFARFRFLSPLLLKAGRYNYVRTCTYVLGTFYKEMLFYVTQAFFQRYNGYTATSLYESWSMSMFNTLFTSLPVIAIGIFMQDLRPETLLAVPELYSIGRLNRSFSIKKYLWWAGLACAEASLIFFTMWALYGLSNSAESSLFSMGDLCFSAIVVVINTKLLVLEMKSITWVAVVAWWLSVGGWTLWNVLLSLVYSQKEQLSLNVHQGFLGHFGRNAVFWVVTVFSIATILALEVGIVSVRKLFYMTDTEVFRQLERDPVIMKRLIEAAGGEEGTELGRAQSAKEGEVQDLLDNRRDDMDGYSIQPQEKRRTSEHVEGLGRKSRLHAEQYELETILSRGSL